MTLETLAFAAVDPDFNDGLTAYAWAFGQGVLVDLTPCVYPLIPITVAVFGAKGVSRARALFLATAYVLGMAVLYTALGVFVALSGAAFGEWLGDPRVVIPIALLLVALAASMFGAFDIQLPTSMQNRLNTVGGAGPLGAFLMGLVSGLISAPCTGPVLLSLLAYIAKSSAAGGGGVVYGGSLLFVYALGMGTLFFAVALGASLFKPGVWMEHIKSVFGIALLVMAAWFLRPISKGLEGLILDPTWGLWLGMGIAALGLLLGAVHLSFKATSMERLRKGAGVAIATFGGIVALNNVLYVPPMDWHEVVTFDDLDATVKQAEADGKPILIDFAAAWCLPCKELEKLTFHDESVEPRLAKEFHLVKIDVTEPNDDQETMKSAFAGGTLPAVIVYDSDAQLSASIASMREGGSAPPPAAHFKTFVEADVFLDAIDDVK